MQCNNWAMAARRITFLVGCGPQMARTQKNKATSGHLGMLKVGP